MDAVGLLRIPWQEGRMKLGQMKDPCYAELDPQQTGELMQREPGQVLGPKEAEWEQVWYRAWDDGTWNRWWAVELVRTEWKGSPLADLSRQSVTGEFAKKKE